jgi:hypothetical protein
MGTAMSVGSNFLVLSAMLMLVSLSAVISPQVFAQPVAAHVHGVAHVEIVQDGNEVSFGLSSPLDNLLGFEHAPRSAKQKKAVQDMLDYLNKPEAWFRLTQAAQCEKLSIAIESEVLGMGHAGTPVPAVPSIASAPKYEHKQDHKHEHAHADISVEVVFRCRAPTALKGASLHLFDVFSQLARVKAQIVSPRGQSAATLSARQRQLSW